MITFLVVYKHNASISEVKNLKFLSDGAPNLSEIQMKIMDANKWKLTDFAILNIIPIKTEIIENCKIN